MIVLDTHVLVWWLSAPARLSARARRTISSATRKNGVVASTISVFEIATAARRRRLEFSIAVSDWIDTMLRVPELRIEPISAEIARVGAGLDESMPGDPADRLIMATAMVLGARLVTADDRLRGVTLIDTVW